MSKQAAAPPGQPPLASRLHGSMRRSGAEPGLQRGTCLVMKASWAALMFSGLPPQALSADACSARPYEKDSAHGLRAHAYIFRICSRETLILHLNTLIYSARPSEKDSAHGLHACARSGSVTHTATPTGPACTCAKYQCAECFQALRKPRAAVAHLQTRQETRCQTRQLVPGRSVARLLSGASLLTPAPLQSGKSRQAFLAERHRQPRRGARTCAPAAGSWRPG